jgi:hypothetical protein
MKEEKDFEFFKDVLITAFVSFFAVYPFVLDLLEKRSKALDAFIISVAFTLIMVILILLWSSHFSKKERQ